MKNFRSKDKKVLVSTLEWKECHPGGIDCESDAYYARLATSLATTINSRVGREPGITQVAVKATAEDIASYLEDKVTGMNMWNAFISLYQEEYERAYPFYDEVKKTDLIAAEPNYPDVRFLLWRGLNRSNPATLLNPRNEMIAALAEDIFNVIIEEYEVAPESPELREWVFNEEYADDPEAVRSRCGWIVARSYLFGIAKDMETFEPIMQMFSLMFDENHYNLDVMGYASEVYFYMSVKCGPLKLLPSKWLARMLQLNPNKDLQRLAPRVDAIETRELLPYKVISVDEESITLMNIAGYEIVMSKNMFDDSASAVAAGDTLSCASFFYNGEWQLNGVSLISQEKNVDFNEMIATYKKQAADAKETCEVLLEKNGNCPIGVAKDWTEFSTRFALDKAQSKDFNGMEKTVKDATKILYFINSDGNITILPLAAVVVKTADNPFYDVKRAERGSASLLFDQQLTNEMRKYIIDHNLMPDARLTGPMDNDVAKKWFAENEKFLSSLLTTDEPVFNKPELAK